ncbi:unnamed protein product [Auanema sp. JU1783]|nr:unnamed protein product [Auanema sp. JU1783]
MDGHDSVWLLCDRLRAEKLLVSSEVTSLRDLHITLERKLTDLGSLSWMNRHYQIILSRLLSSHALVSPENTAAIASKLEAVEVVEAYKRLGYHHSEVARGLQLLLSSPKSVAELLHSVDGSQTISTEDAVQSMFSLIYGNGIFPSDEKIILEVLTHLVKVQLVCANDPRLILRKGNAAFPRLYRLFSESLFTSKIFLTSALHDSVMLVLCQDDIFLDIDPSKSVLRFPMVERVRRFGDDPTSSLYHKKVAAHRKIIVEKLVLLAHNFIKGICDSLNIFPASLIYLVKELHMSLVNRGLSDSEVMLICSDLIVTNLICPAIANPETIGIISDTPISHIARFNLMQIGQIIQTLVLSRHEAPPPHFHIFATQFRDSQISTIVETLLAKPTPSLDSLFPVLLAGSNRTHELFCRQHFMGSLFEVNVLLSILQDGIVENISSASIRDDLSFIGKKLPNSFTSGLPAADVTPPSQQTGSRLRNFRDKVQTSLNASSPQKNTSPIKSASATVQEQSTQLSKEYFDLVLFINESNGERIGLIAEETYMESIGKDTNKRSRKGKEKRARFVETSSIVGSAISDRTTDHASDLEEETADEVASVSSSQEAPQEDKLLLMEEDNASTLPDNVSDVGGMSGRGSPSLSGRDTPLSQLNRDNEAMEQEGDIATASISAGVAAVSLEQRDLPSVPIAVRKENAEGLEEKFGKFTVPTSDQNRTYRDDQRSLLSDSWSTNVVASDDETSAPVPPLPQLPPLDIDNNRAARAVNRTSSVGGGNLGEDRSDTWSLDAIASDSEADGGRERERQVRDIQEDVQERERAEANQAELIAAVQFIDVTSGDRMRRQSSGSSFSYSRSDVGSERDHEEERQNVPPLPAKPPVFRNSSNEPRSNDSRSIHSSPVSRDRPPIEVSVPGPSRVDVGPPKRTLGIFQGLQKVGDKVRKGIASTPLRQLPHSSTLSDLFGDNSVSSNQAPGLSSSRSENRLADMDRLADDILAKYQKQSPSVLIDVSDEVRVDPTSSITREEIEDNTPYYCPEKLSQCRAFLDAKRKLRLVLSSAGGLPSVELSKEEKERSGNDRDQLTGLLRTLLAEAINGRQQVLSAHIREVMRCIQVFDSKGIRKLLKTLREEHRRRTSYVTYLQNSRLTLLRLTSYLDRLSSRIARERNLTSDCLVDVLIRFYLENKDSSVRVFIHDFSTLKAQDEKIEALTKTLNHLYTRMTKSSMWSDSPTSMLTYSRLALERVLMAHIHVTAFYPNHEADRHRDDLFQKAASRLARTITPDHPMLRIPRVLHGEAPWPSAQAEINVINAYKAAKDKLACIVRCCETISNLVSMAPGVGAAAADDVTPVLVYVLIQANPPALFSNLQYIQSFCFLEGAEGYWFTQFTAAIEVIKTLL